jgi:hypothetical protein
MLLQLNRIAEAQEAWRRAMHYGANTEIRIRAQQRLNTFGSLWGSGT